MIGLDTDFIIDFLRNKKEAVDLADNFRNEMIATTQINFFEILTGLYRKEALRIREEKSTMDFFNNLNVLDLDRNGTVKSAEIAGNLMLKGSMIEPNDCLIAGILLANGCNTIITRNIRHYSKIKGLKIQSY